MKASLAHRSYQLTLGDFRRKISRSLGAIAVYITENQSPNLEKIENSLGDFRWKFRRRLGAIAVYLTGNQSPNSGTIENNLGDFKKNQFLFDWLSELASKPLIFSNILFDSHSEIWTKPKPSNDNLDDLKSIFRRDLDAREPYLIGYQSAKMELKNFNLDGF